MSVLLYYIIYSLFIHKLNILQKQTQQQIVPTKNRTTPTNIYGNVNDQNAKRNIDLVQNVFMSLLSVYCTNWYAE
jgi:hypothetical protein